MERFAFAIDLLQPRAADHILEIGCGTGLAASLLIPLLPKGKLHLIDRSASMINKVKAKLAPSGRNNIVTAEQAFFPDWKNKKSFDKIMAFNVSDCWGKNCLFFLSAMAGHLKSDGECWIFHQGPPGSGSRLNKTISDKLQQLASQAGLVIFCAEEGKMPPSPVLAIGMKPLVV